MEDDRFKAFIFFILIKCNLYKHHEKGVSKTFITYLNSKQ